MKSIHALIASISCFAIAVALGYYLWLPEEEFVFQLPLDFVGITFSDVRSAAFVMLGVDVAIGLANLAVWYSARRADAQLKNNLSTFDPTNASDDIHKTPSEHIRPRKTQLVRAAFTLIELLVVIAIIGILAALSIVGVVALLRKGPEVNNRNDILQIGIALDKFKTEYGFYPPSKFKLCKSRSEYGNTALDQSSVSTIAAMWKNLGNFQNIAWTAAGPGDATFQGGTPSLPVGGVILDGDQCLVFFLGGPPNLDGQKGLLGGFSTNPLDPAYRPYIFPVGTQPYPPNHPDLGRKKFFDFETSRLFNRGGSPFPSYLDSHSYSGGKQMPFAYFSSYKRNNGYSPFGMSDNLSLGVSPYQEPATPPMVKYINPTTYQLISAGADGQFGPGGIWNPSSIASQGRDDISNFSDRNLGVAP